VTGNYDDDSGIPKIPEPKTCNYDYRLNRKKKQSVEQCELDENVKDVKIKIVYSIKENLALVREAERLICDYDAQRFINNLVEQLSLGNRNPGIGTAKNFVTLMDRGEIYFLGPGCSFIIVKKLTKEIIEEAVETFVENNAYWLKNFTISQEEFIRQYVIPEHTEHLKELDKLDNS
jgi:hypothetical protein